MARERILISAALALLLHVALLLVLQILIRFERSRVPDYVGPLFVEIEETSTVSSARMRESAVEQPRQSRAEARAPVRESQPQRAPAAQSAPAPSPAGRQASAAAASGLARSTEEPQGPLKPSWTTEGQAAAPRSSVEEPFLPQRNAGPQASVASQQAQTSQSSPLRSKEPADSPQGQPSLNLGELDQRLSGSAAATGTSGGAAASAAGRAGSGGQTSSAAAGSGGDGAVIEFDNPTEGRDTMSTPQPEIPDWVKREGRQLVVTVGFSLTPAGVLIGLEVKKSSGISDVDSAVLDALRRWKFTPAVSGSNVTGRVTYVITPR